MSAAVVVFRKTALEDLEVTGTPGATFSANVLTPTGSVPTTLTKIPMTLLTQLGSYANDTAAATGGVGVGEIYIKSGNGRMTARMT